MVRRTAKQKSFPMTSRRKRGPADKSNGTAVDYALGDAPGHLLRRCQQRAVEIFMAETGGARGGPRPCAVLLALPPRPGPAHTALSGWARGAPPTARDLL